MAYAATGRLSLRCGGAVIGRYWRCPLIPALPSVVRVSADLVALGLDALDPQRHGVYTPDGVAVADPDGNEFCLLAIWVR